VKGEPAFQGNVLHRIDNETDEVMACEIVRCSFFQKLPWIGRRGGVDGRFRFDEGIGTFLGEGATFLRRENEMRTGNLDGSGGDVGDASDVHPSRNGDMDEEIGEHRFP
jgi:hypothetical protein